MNSSIPKSANWFMKWNLTTAATFRFNNTIFHNLKNISFPWIRDPLNTNTLENLKTGWHRMTDLLSLLKIFLFSRFPTLSAVLKLYKFNTDIYWTTKSNSRWNTFNIFTKTQYCQKQKLSKQIITQTKWYWTGAKKTNQPNWSLFPSEICWTNSFEHKAKGTYCLRGTCISEW